MTADTRILVYQDGERAEPHPETLALARTIGASVDFFDVSEGRDLSRAICGALNDCAPFLLLSSNIRHTDSLGSLLGYLRQEAEESGDLKARTTAVGPSSPVFLYDQRTGLSEGAPMGMEALEEHLAKEGHRPVLTTSLDARCLAVMSPTVDYAEQPTDEGHHWLDAGEFRGALQLWVDNVLVPRLSRSSLVKAVPFVCVVPDVQEPSPYCPVKSLQTAEALSPCPPATAPRIAALYTLILKSQEGWLAFEESLKDVRPVVDAIVIVAVNSPKDVMRRPTMEGTPLLPAVAKMWEAPGGAERRKVFNKIAGLTDPAAIQKTINAYLKKVVGGKVHLHILGKGDAPATQGGDIQGAVMRVAERVCNEDLGWACDWAFTPAVGMYLEEGVGYDELHRVASIPKGKVVSFDFGVRTLISDELVLVKRPYGDDGDMTDDCGDDMLTPALYRFGYREYRACLAGCRPANIVSYSKALVSPYAVRSVLVAENAPAESVTKNRALGLSYLTYSGEPIGSLLRWLEDTWALARKSVVVWTDETPPPADLYRHLTNTWGADVVHQPLRDDFAMARNAGFAKLREYPELHFGGFFDPDEFVNDPARDLRALRRMADRPQAIGWLVVAMNARVGGEEQAESRSIRFFNLKLPLWMVGRVHESFAEALTLLNERLPNKDGIREHGKFTIFNPGLAFSKEAFQRKAARYAALIAAELGERPHHANAWLSLYHNYVAGGWYDEARRAIACAVHCARDREFSPRYHMGLFQIFEAKAVMRSALEAAPPNAPLYRSVYGVNRHLDALPDFPTPTLEGDPTPPFPDEAEAALIAMGGAHPLIFATGDDVMARLQGCHEEAPQQEHEVLAERHEDGDLRDG